MVCLATYFNTAFGLHLKSAVKSCLTKPRTGKSQSQRVTVLVKFLSQFICFLLYNEQTTNTNKNKLRGLSPKANYTDRVTAACQRIDLQLLRIEGVVWSAQRIPTAVFSVF
jgi:hypothetical protein